MNRTVTAAGVAVVLTLTACGPIGTWNASYCEEGHNQSDCPADRRANFGGEFYEDSDATCPEKKVRHIPGVPIKSGSVTIRVGGSTTRYNLIPDSCVIELND